MFGVEWGSKDLRLVLFPLHPFTKKQIPRQIYSIAKNKGTNVQGPNVILELLSNYGSSRPLHTRKAGYTWTFLPLELKDN